MTLLCLRVLRVTILPSHLNAAYDDGVNPPKKIPLMETMEYMQVILTRDGAVDGRDMNVIDNNVGFFGYDNSDINGDGATDGQIWTLLDNNSQLGLFFARLIKTLLLCRLSRMLRKMRYPAWVLLLLWNEKAYKTLYQVFVWKI